MSERLSMTARGSGEDFERRGRNMGTVKERSVSRDLKITIKTAVGSGDGKDADEGVGNGDAIRRSVEGCSSVSNSGSALVDENERFGRAYRNGEGRFHSGEDNGIVLTTGTGGNEFDYEDEANRAGGGSDEESSRSFEFTKGISGVARENKYESKFFSS